MIIKLFRFKSQSFSTCLIIKLIPELKLLMNVQQDHCSKKSTLMCTLCTEFFGSTAYGGLCSSCHKKTNGSKKEECAAKSPAQTSTPVSIAEKELMECMEQLTLEPVKKEQSDRKRCFGCNKKVGLLGIECKCSYVFCNAHRLPENHECEFNHKQSGKDKLKKEVVKVYNGKIAHI